MKCLRRMTIGGWLMTTDCNPISKLDRTAQGANSPLSKLPLQAAQAVQGRLLPQVWDLPHGPNIDQSCSRRLWHHPPGRNRGRLPVAGIPCGSPTPGIGYVPLCNMTPSSVKSSKQLSAVFHLLSWGKTTNGTKGRVHSFQDDWRRGAAILSCCLTL